MRFFDSAYRSKRTVFNRPIIAGMDSPLNYSPSSLRRSESNEPEADPDAVRPYGRFGVGTLTSHPVGLVVVVGVVLMAIFGIPGALPFFAGAIALGGVIGLFLWLYNRNRGF
jgi:hypothetical protein